MGIEDTNEVLVNCDGCRLRGVDGGGQSLRFSDRPKASTYLREVGWTQDGDNWYCPACRPKLTLPERWRLVGGTLALDTTQVHCKAIGGQNACPIWAISDQRMGILKDVLPIVLAAPISAAAVRIAYDFAARPADFNRGEILALLAQALRAAEPEVTP